MSRADRPRPRRLCRGGGLFFLGIAASLAPVRAGDDALFVSEPRPAGTVVIARPSLFWRVWPGLTGGKFELDGKPVPTRLDPARRGIVHTPDAPLAAGKHGVVCTATIGKRGTTRREWTFEVAPGALPTLPRTLSAAEASALQATLRWRRRLGLRFVDADPNLRLAALAHSEYLRRNRAGGHDQDPARPAFVGAQPLARARRFGSIDDGVGEDVAVQELSPPDDPVALSARAVEDLFAAPYHRLPFLDPGFTRLGVGFVHEHEGEIMRTYLTLLFGATEDPDRPAQVVVSPADGERDVPTAWRDSESPDPLRLHRGVTRPVGYPIVFGLFAPRHPARPPERLQVADVTVTEDSGRRVPVLLNRPESDPELKGKALIVLPVQPLRPYRRYRIAVRAYNNRGDEVGRSWSFTTGTDPAPAETEP